MSMKTWPSGVRPSGTTPSAGALERQGEPAGAEGELRLVAERAAGEESAHRVLRRRHAGGHARDRRRLLRGGRRAGGGRRLPDANATATSPACCSDSAATSPGPRTASGAAPRKCTTTGLPAAAAAARIFRAIAGAGGFEISTMTRVAGSFGERREPLQHRDAADLLLEVAPAGAERLRHAAARVVDAARHFLQSGAGRRDEPDVAAPHDVGEAQRNAVDDGRSAVGPHDEEVARRARTS